MHPPFEPSGSSSSSDIASGPGKRHARSQTPGPSGDDLAAPSPQRPRTDSQVAREAGDAEYRERHKIDPRDFASSAELGDRDFQSALRFSLEGRPSYDIMFPIGEPALTADRTVFSLAFRSIPSKKTYIRKEGDEGGTADGAPSGFNGFSGLGIDKSTYAGESALAPGLAGRESIRLNPPKAPPPALRKNAVREVSTSRSAPGQAGFPPIMNADASIGLSGVSYQGAEVALNPCEAGKFALSRLLGTSSCAHSENKTDITQRAEVGCWPCCARATHVATPPTYALGEYPPLKARVLALWGNSGP